MPELKVQCACGQKFKFDVEPVNNRMPFTVNCPICGVDGTEKANALLQERASTAPSPLPPPPAPSTSYGVPPSTPLVPAVPMATEKPRLRINTGGSHTAPPATSVEKEQGTSSVDAAIAATGGGSPSRFPSGATAARPAKVYKDPEALNLPMGILGAVIGGAMGMAGWYFLTKATQHEYGYAAWVVGLLTGIGARILGRAGDTTLGIAAAICALVAMLGARYLVLANVMSQVDSMVEGIGAMAYAAEKEMAKDAVNVQTDEEIKALYQKMNFGRASSESDLKKFKEEKLPELKDIASGKLTEAQFIKKLNKAASNAMAEAGEKSGFDFGSRWQIFKSSFESVTYFILAIGAFSAFRLGSRE